MAETKKQNRAPTTPAALAPVNAAWATFFALAEDARAELHKQTAAVIGVTDGALDGATRFANNVNDRVAELARQTLVSAERAGRDLATGARSSVRRVAAASRDSADRIAETTRGAAERASATAKALVSPSERKAA